MRSISLSKLLGRQGLIRNYDLSKTKNYLRDDDEFTGVPVCTNQERVFYLAEKDRTYNYKRYRALKV
jgi:hypothetical protein